MVHIIQSYLGEFKTDNRIWRNIPNKGTIIGYFQFFTPQISKIQICKVHLEEKTVY